MIHYTYTHKSTKAATGYFSCDPVPEPSLEDALAYLAGHPLDDFMRRYLLARIAALSPHDAEQSFLNAYPGQDFPPAVQALLCELVLLNPVLAQQLLFAEADAAGSDPAASSLIFLNWQQLPDRDAHRRWGRFFKANIHGHQMLKPVIIDDGAPLYPDPAHGSCGHGDPSLTRLPGQGAIFQSPFPVHIKDLHALYKDVEPPGACARPRPPASETGRIAEERLSRLGIIAGQEMRHTASLSPVALLRPWNVRIRVRQDRHDYSLAGQGITYGRGLSLDDARASCLMEMVERASAYLSINQDHITDRAADMPILVGSRSTLMEKHGAAIDPNDYPLETSYKDAPLVWVRGLTSRQAQEYEPVYVPVQMAGLFCNLDEPGLMDAFGSTGIAAGCSLEEAKIAALLEILERDAEATTPFAKDMCFTLDAADDEPAIAALLADYAARGINVQFQDITGPMGVPVYQCFVMSPKGAVARGYGAGLAGRRALLSALTETPFPYPDKGPSGPALRKLPRKKLHELPDYSLPSPAAGLALLEELLIKNARAPVYVELTRKDLQFPVVRALLPGMELNADWDDFSRVPLRLYAHYRRKTALSEALIYSV